MTVLASTDITAFHIIGAVLAVWAVVVAGLGIRRHSFPGKAGAERLVVGLTALLVVGAVGSAVATSGEEEPKGHEIRDVPQKGGKEGSETPEQGAIPSPESDRESGQGDETENAPDAPEGQISQTLMLTADPTGKLAFDKSTLEAEAGPVRIVANNPADVPHDVSLEGNGVDEKGETVPKGGSSQVSVELKPGKYTFYCSVAGHRDAGMQGTLTVK